LFSFSASIYISNALVLFEIKSSIPLIDFVFYFPIMWFCIIPLLEWVAERRIIYSKLMNILL